MARKRPSMKGMGADAFFDTPVNQQTGKPGDQQASNPGEQQESIPTSQQDGLPVNQHTAKPTSQQTGIADDEFIKATFYLTQDHIMKLEHIRLGRKQKGIKVDKSALVREAIDLLKEEPVDQ